MTDGETRLLQSFLERFDRRVGDLEQKIDDGFSGFNDRLEALESDRDKRVGRNNFIVNAAKTIGGLLAAALAALGIKSQVG